ncbi:MAG: PBP1A family penicillin-binding protein [Armatimonadetes bacterium]|nr:PBP1A family penicillin-binding protein [Armatimonadota bacterium]
MTRIVRRRFQRPTGRPWWRILLIVGAGLLGFAVVAFGIIAGMTLSFARTLPDISALYNPPSESTRIYASSGELIASLYRENRDFVSLSEVPESLQQAVIAVEDDRFYQHSGVDVRGTLRAMWRNLQARELIEGGSTITQQLARTIFLTQKRQVSRKLAEMILAVEIERRLTKTEILERYLNQVYFGQGAYGVEMAARVYFGKHAKALDLPQSALLAGLIRGPSIYSPYQNLTLAKERQLVALRRMVELGYVSGEKARRVASQPIKLAAESNAGLVGIRAPYFVSFILPYLLERYGEDLVYNGGLRVYTTLDLKMQIAAEKVVRDGIDAAQDRLKVTQGALVALDPNTGFIRAMIGGYDFTKSQFNRAWQARRQPGSSFKPFIYVTAVANGMSPAKVIVDAPITYDIPGTREKIWKPRNYDGKFSGNVTMRQALERSINIPAIKTLAELGSEQVITYAKRMGIKSPLQPNLSLALGTNEVTPIEMASAYGTLATLGVRADPIAVRRVLSRDGQVLEDNPPRQELVISADVAYVMVDLLKGVITRGTGRAAALGRPAAGKTGTTDDYRNAWFIGFTPRLSTAVWVGNDDNSPMRRVVGGTVPARIWAAFMRVATERMPADDWRRPDGVVVVTVCGSTGLLATSACPNPRQEAFIRGTEPTDYALAQGIGNGATVGNLPLRITTPGNGQRVISPFPIEGTTVPGATVNLSILAQGGFLRISVADTQLPVTAEGQFRYTFRPSLQVPGVQYIITVTATSPDGSRSTTTITVSEE